MRDPYTVDPLSQLKMSWLLRQRLRRVTGRRKTGLLMQGIIRTPSRSMSSKTPLVAVREGNTRLGMVTSAFQIPKWVPLAPGEHILSFAAVRSSGASRFTKSLTLAEGDVLIAVCEPIQPWTIFGKSPLLDHWYLGVISVKQQNADKIGRASGAHTQRLDECRVHGGGRPAETLEFDVRQGGSGLSNSCAVGEITA